jgi:hypothetical protein
MRCQIKFSTRASPEATLKTLWQVERECLDAATALRWAATVLERTEGEVLQTLARVQVSMEAVSVPVTRSVPMRAEG